MTSEFVLAEAWKIYQVVGPVGAILLVLSVFSLTLIIAKALHLLSAGMFRFKGCREALAAVETGNWAAAASRLATERGPTARIMREGLQFAETTDAMVRVEAAVNAAATREIARLQRHNRMLELIGLIAPLLGLLGTILGMIEAFQALQTSGAEADPALLAGGIWEALLTTALGLTVAIPAIVAFNLAENRLERFRQQAGGLVARFLAALETR